MDAQELNYRGVLPHDDEDLRSYVGRGEKFIDAAYGLQDALKDDACDVLLKNGIIKQKLLQKRYVAGNPKLVEDNSRFFEIVYQTNLDWVSLIEADCIGAGGCVQKVSFSKMTIPIAIVDPIKGPENTDHHEKIHCMRNDFWDVSALSPEEQFTCGLANNEWKHEPAVKYDKHQSYKKVAAGLLGLGGLGLLTHGTPPTIMLEYLSVSLAAIPQLYLIFDGLATYRELKIDPTKTAFDMLLSANTGFDDISDVRYSLLRLKTGEVREIGKYMRKNNIKSGKSAIKGFLKKRKDLRSELILKHID